MGTENSLKSALVTVFTDGELDLEGDETGTEEVWDVQTESTLSPLTPLLILSSHPLSPSPSLPLSLPQSFFSASDGRSKTKLMVDGKCKLLLIREETGGPSKQVSLWADVIMFVFSYANQDSLREVRVGKGGGVRGVG